MHYVVAGLATFLLIAGIAFAMGRVVPDDEPRDTDVATDQPTDGETAQGAAAGTTEPSPEPANAPSPYEGLPVSTPLRGEPTRTALMDAARARTGTDSQFLVWQLFMQGDSAIGDIQEARGASAPGSRWLVTWERSGDTWTATYHVVFLDAERRVMGDAAAYLSEDILGEMLFMEPFVAPAELTEAARIATNEGYPGEIEAPTRIPEGWRFSYRAADYGQPGGIPGTRHWHFQEYSDGARTITQFIGSPEGDFSQPTETPTTVNWSTGQTAYLYEDSMSGVAAVGFGDGAMNEWYESYLWADGDTPQLRAALTAMAMSIRQVP